MAQAQPLAGKGIVVTRPRGQALALAELIATAGGNPILFPTIEIRPLPDDPALAALIARLDQFKVAVFVSANAVDQALHRIALAGRALPAHLKLVAVGPGTARRLEAHGLRDIIVPARFDSEGLLELTSLQNVEGSKVVIFRGQGGRELLGGTLEQRGASVEYAQCYSRELPASDARPLITTWENKALQAITVTSSEALRNLLTLLGTGGRALLMSTPLFVPHPRIEKTAHELGLTTVVLTEHGNAGLVDGMARWFAATSPIERGLQHRRV